MLTTEQSNSTDPFEFHQGICQECKIDAYKMFAFAKSFEHQGLLLEFFDLKVSLIDQSSFNWPAHRRQQFSKTFEIAKAIKSHKEMQEGFFYSVTEAGNTVCCVCKDMNSTFN